MTVIKVDNLGKKYVLSHQQREPYTALRDVMARKFKSAGRSLLTPFTFHRSPLTDSSHEDFWALKDVSFEIKQGESVGVIGRNGAGKSTLLKILSRITEPTTGRVGIKGRVASLLEVGTGFHPELTGRENIFLNGAIMGMAKAEIKRKFDEIVAFAEVEKFLDTPVKRYSSGMYVRLAFAVAAHLEPEILIVDEVLAVGDAQFQKKCLGKMGDVAKGGRTVLFVSHNMTAIQTLCSRAIYLNYGMVVYSGNTQIVINEYLSKGLNIGTEKSWPYIDNASGNDNIRIHAIRVIADNGEQSIFTIKTAIRLEFEYSLFLDNILFYVGVHVRTISGECAFVTASSPAVTSSGRYKTACYIPGDLLNSGTYTLHVFYVRDGCNVLFEIEAPVFFEIHDVDRPEGAWIGAIPGAVRPLLKWETDIKEKYDNS